MSESYIILSCLKVDFFILLEITSAVIIGSRSRFTASCVKAGKEFVAQTAAMLQIAVYFFLCFDMPHDTISLLCGIRRSSMDNEGDKVISGRSMNACTEGGSHR
ncbi:hypothetical protein [Paenibacillus sp. JGP012]|uniref:hypothetical protein n=1 Tax=Paenibacillus sp. JGP012 TaxID=2735914 RepID=UPI001C88D9F5|nr:hypothetical protein [Paenibacillus sp. JGP012]